VEEVEDELVIYDKRADSAHRLNRTAAVVWRHCDGEHDVPALVDVLRTELGGDLADEDLVRIALDGLAAKDLIEGTPERSYEDTQLSRRRFIRRVGTVGVAALALPIVSSLAAPTPASAQSPCDFCPCCPCCPCDTCDCDTCTVDSCAAQSRSARQSRARRSRRSPPP
jgi:hypothetical protein